MATAMKSLIGNCAALPGVRAEREALAQRVADVVNGAFTKLAAAKDDIDNLWIEFRFLPKGETIMGCATKTEFCEKVLGRSIRAVQYMLDGGNHKRHETVSPHSPQTFYSPNSEITLPADTENEALPVESVEPVRYTDAELQQYERRAGNENRLESLFQDCSFPLYVKQNSATNEPRFNVVFSAISEEDVRQLSEIIATGLAVLTEPTSSPSDPTPSTPAPIAVPYTPDFLTQEEHDSLFAACNSLPFSTTLTRWNKESRHATVTYGPEEYKMRSEYKGEYFPLDAAPDAIKMLQQKLSEYVGKTIDYLSIVRYLDEKGGMTWHQHDEDRHGQDASVWIVRTGTERTLSIRRKGEKGRGAATHMLLAKGSLAVLPSAFNDTHEHAVLDYKGAGLCYSINAKCLPTKDDGPRKPRCWDCHAGKKYPNDAVYVGCRTKGHNGDLLREGSIFGNALRPLECRGPNNPAVTHNDAAVFQTHALEKMKDPEFRKQVESLRGKDLLCWCKDTADFCHARVWLELANA
jgi:uncharacterized Zn-finger protein